MSLRVFAPSPGLSPHSTILLDPDESHYLVRVRRARVGDPIELFDPRGGLFQAVVRTVDPKAASVEVRDRIETPDQVDQALELGLALVDPKALVRALERACEAGARRIVLLRTQNTQFPPPSTARVDRALRASQRQCGRPLPPSVEGPRDLNTWLNEDPALPGYLAHRRLDGAASEGVDDMHRGRARLLIGPEGGLTSQEVAQALARGFRLLQLGPWILRTEIAVTAGLTRLRYG